MMFDDTRDFIQAHYLTSRPAKTRRSGAPTSTTSTCPTTFKHKIAMYGQAWR